jgi:hypothetical protein
MRGVRYCRGDHVTISYINRQREQDNELDERQRGANMRSHNRQRAG